MKRKSLFALAIALILLSQPLFALADSAPLLYRVTDEAGHVIYLLGTIHVGDKDMYPMGDAVEKAWRESDALAVEMDVQMDWTDWKDLLKYASAMMYGFGDNITKHFSGETYALGVEKFGMPAWMLKKLTPIAWYSLAENYMAEVVGLSALWGTDYQLLQRAKAENKPIHELESMGAQLAVLEGISEKLLDEQVRLILEYPKESGMATRILADAWKRGDAATLNYLLDMSGQDVGAEMEEAYQDFSDSLIDDRNGGFLGQAEAYLKSGEKALIAIGTFHIIGKTGLAAQLEQAGYHVEEVGR